ncbi:hypothetical protein [Undibacterium sp.]|uniref:hypothetical protein n=1 Tax=Undibacterium sp. TaxID=1914977 RepID=UPI00272F05B7|nr:hypothetical protein [Undibacterium sp.]MDP1977862.1 hypothetical protein [Undibacterium sp.]
MKKKWMLIMFAATAQTCLAGGSLTEELAAERGVKVVNVDLLGRAKTAPIRPQIMSCGGAPMTSRAVSGNVLQNKDGKMSAATGQPPAPQEFNVEKMKESLIEISRQASSIRYQAALAQGEKKKSCNLNLTE